jgi:hypothetical protein
MTNTPESDTMKTLTELAKEQGAIVADTSRQHYYERWLDKGEIVFDNEAQLLATFNAWSAQQGWKLVPIEPTDEMKEKGWEAYRDSNKPAPYNMLTDAYKAMLSASPLKG